MEITFLKRTARKNHYCVACHKSILKGSVYLIQEMGVTGGWTFNAPHIHTECETLYREQHTAKPIVLFNPDSTHAHRWDIDVDGHARCAVPGCPATRTFQVEEKFTLHKWGKHFDPNKPIRYGMSKLVEDTKITL